MSGKKILSTTLTALFMTVAGTSGAVAQGVTLSQGLATTTAAPVTAESGRTVVVRMVGYSFEPAEISVRRGDVIHFVQKGSMPHNVEFREQPEGAVLGDLQVGPYLIREGDTYDINVDSRFASGTYRFVCTPHESLNMNGTITVTEAIRLEMQLD